MKRNYPWFGVTGHQFEEEFISLGKVRVTWNGQYISYNQSMAVVRANQEPNSALCEAGIKFRNEIARQMNVGVEEIKVFGSIETCLDEKHGVDMFVDWKGLTVTIDLTINPQKQQAKADVIVSKEDVNNGFVLAADRVKWAFRQLARPSLSAR
jgi:hypothetical protein